MRTSMRVAAIVTGQVVLVALAVAPQLSARLTGETYRLRVAPVDPIDPFRGAYVALDYPDLRQGAPDGSTPGVGHLEDGERGDLYITLQAQGDLWVAGEWSRQRPAVGPYLTCNDRDWRTRCGIESYFLPQDKARQMEQTLSDGAVAEVRIDSRGNAAVVAVE